MQGLYKFCYVKIFGKRMQLGCYKIFGETSIGFAVPRGQINRHL